MKIKKTLLAFSTISIVGTCQLPILSLTSCGNSDPIKSINGSDWSGVIKGEFRSSDYELDHANKLITYVNASHIYASNLVIPNYVYVNKEKYKVFIGHNCFFECQNILGSVELNDFITEIPYDCFNGCKRLTSLVFHQQPVLFDWFACHDCQNLSKIYVKQNNVLFEDWTTKLLYIGDSAFYNTKIGDDFIAGRWLSWIGNHAFEECEQLRTIDLSFAEDLYILGDSAFGYCDHINYVYLPANLIWIGDSTFIECNDLVKVYLEYDNYPLWLGDMAFRSCDKFIGFNKSVNLLNCGNSCFLNDLQLSTQLWYAPNSAPSINKESFENTGFTYISIPPKDKNGPADVGYKAFSNCPNLTIIDVSGFTQLPDWTGTEIFTNLPTFGTIYVSESVWNKGNVSDEWYTYFIEQGLTMSPKGEQFPQHWHFAY